MTVLCVVGPTASGKTKMAVALARRLNGEVVSVDSMQIYRGMTIGTAAPTAEEMEGVPHHMIAVADPAEQWSAARYAQAAIPIVDDILKRGKLPILVGGTGLWLDAVVQGREFAPGQAGGAIRRELGVVLGGIDFYPKKKIRVITDVTRRFYDNWDEGKYRHYLNLFAIDEEKRVDQLSSGMKVKYMIALALSHNARLLILDEPTSGLDPVSRDELTELLRRLVADGTRSVLFSTHITSDLEKCATHIAFIKDGEMQYTGSLGDFRDHYKDVGVTLEDIIVHVERRPLDEGAII